MTNNSECETIRRGMAVLVAALDDGRANPERVARALGKACEHLARHVDRLERRCTALEYREASRRAEQEASRFDPAAFFAQRH